jgi:transcriptional regulator with XRE-family HTH domain
MTAIGYVASLMEGRQIKAARALLGWSQTDLCREAGISRATLNDLENDTGDPRRSSSNRVEDAFRRGGVIFLSEGDTRDGGIGVRVKRP